VSDHGMADTESPDWIFLEDYIGEQGVARISHEDCKIHDHRYCLPPLKSIWIGWPLMGLRFEKGSNESHYIEALQNAAVLNNEKFDVYTHDTMPERYHFSHNPRIATVYVVPKLGYAVTRSRKPGLTFVKGNHGYDNELPEMQAVFIADGPFSRGAKIHSSFDSANGTPTVIDDFDNVEVKGLVAKIFGIELEKTSHNGTAGFWDKYF